MNRILVIIVAFVLTLLPGTQGVCQTKSSRSAKTTTTAKRGATSKSAAAKKTQRKPAAKKKAVAKKRGKKSPVYTNASIRGLQNQRAEVQKKIKEQERLLRANKADVKKRLDDLLAINSEIDQRQKSIDGIQSDITHIEGNISLLRSQLSTLEQQLEERKAKYVKSMRYLAKSRTIQDKLMFIFSAKSLTQMYRRLRFVREYAAYQRAQGELVRAKQNQITDKHRQLENVKGEKNNLLYKGKQEKEALQGKQTEQQQMVSSLQKQQKTIQTIIADQKKKNAALNAQIDKLIAEEVAKAKARAEEAKRRREAELARKKAAAEAAARENARRVQEAKEREARLKAEAAKAAEERRDAEARRRAEQAARQAEADREAAERKAAVDKKRHEQEVAKAKKEEETAATVSTQDRALSRNFESNRGRLPMPITGGYRIVSHFGQYNVEGLKNVQLDNKGINIQGSSGACARAIFNGEVSAVFGFGGTMVVMVRHGSYISVYCNLRSVSVHRGQQVSTRQTLGVVGADNILQFQLRKGFSKLNPEAWLGR